MSTTRHDHHESTGRKYSPNVPVDALLTRGVAAGLVGGLAFILVNMFAAQSAGKPPIAPFLAISTLFRFSEMPMAQPGGRPRAPARLGTDRRTAEPTSLGSTACVLGTDVGPFQFAQQLLRLTRGGCVTPVFPLGRRGGRRRASSSAVTCAAALQPPDPGDVP